MKELNVKICKHYILPIKLKKLYLNYKVGKRLNLTMLLF